jgi:hypothetical protein
MHYCITSFCFGERFEPVLPIWQKRIEDRCKNSSIKIFNEINVPLPFGLKYAWWDIVRLYNNLELVKKEEKPVIHIDMDIIVEKDVEPLVQLPYDFIISTEIGGDGAFPKECSKIMGFGVCSGFYIIKPTAYNFLQKIYNIMVANSECYSDQVNLMNYFVKNPHTLTEETIELEGIIYKNQVIAIEGIKICVLDFNIVIRDPISTSGQFANHINIDNVGGTENFLKYFDHPIEKLPLTCRCGKTHLGDNSVCQHIEIRRKYLLGMLGSAVPS